MSYDPSDAAYDEFIDSQAQVKKESFHLYGKEMVEIFGKQKKVFLAGIIKQKHYVGFYFSPIYSDPDRLDLSGKLKKILKGKTCFYVKDLSVLEEIEELLIQGKRLYQEKKLI